MADEKLSALIELAAPPADGDELLIRDISEPASDESKRITVANLIAGAGGDHYALTRYLLSGRYHTSAFLGESSTQNSDADTLYALPFITPINRTVTRMAVHVTTGTAGNTMLGIYEDNGSIYPGNLL